MDPISIITGVSGICVTGAKLLFKLSSFVNEVRGVPNSVQSLSNELSAVYTALSQLKITVENYASIPSKTFPAWANDFAVVIENCRVTFGEIEVICEKSKIKTKETNGGQVVKRIRWMWKEGEVLELRERLERYKVSMILILEAANW